MVVLPMSPVAQASISELELLIDDGRLTKPHLAAAVCFFAVPTHCGRFGNWIFHLFTSRSLPIQIAMSNTVCLRPR